VEEMKKSEVALKFLREIGVKLATYQNPSNHPIARWMLLPICWPPPTDEWFKQALCGQYY
jgi:hypothetical protein